MTESQTSLSRVEASFPAERASAVDSHFSSLRRVFRERPELLVFVLLLALANAPVLVGSCFQSLIFQPAAVHAGQWWRVFTHPFVHVTWYHFLLDAMAFLSLYASLMEPRIVRRLTCVVAGAVGSLLCACLATPLANQSLCGLSGIAHGLMAISALEMVGSKTDSLERRIGWVSFVIVVGKASFEALTGRMFFDFLSFGLLGDPVAVSHAGGIIGALVAWGLMMRLPAIKRMT